MEEILRTFNPWWEKAYSSDTIPRPDYVDKLLEERDERDAVLITGIRRVGKSCIMLQTIERLLETERPEHILFVSLDHPAFIPHRILDIVQEHRRMHGLSRDARLFIFLDEVHAKDDFQRDIKALYDMEKVKVFASGSSSMLLLDKGALLTGRRTTVHVRPLSFLEFLAFHSSNISGSESYLYETALDEYMHTGGLPEYVIRDRRPQYILDLVESIITKDITNRRFVKNSNLLRQMVLLLAERVGKTLTYSKLARVLSVTTDTAKEYVSHFEETFLVRTISRHARSLNERVYSPKKVYFADVGIRNVMSGYRDVGAIAENLVFLELARGGDVDYWSDGGREIDFIRNDLAVEVKYKDEITEDDVKTLKGSRSPRRLLITKRPIRIDDVETKTLVDFLRGK